MNQAKIEEIFFIGLKKKKHKIWTYKKMTGVSKTVSEFGATWNKFALIEHSIFSAKKKTNNSLRKSTITHNLNKWELKAVNLKGKQGNLILKNQRLILMLNVVWKIKKLETENRITKQICPISQINNVKISNNGKEWRKTSLLLREPKHFWWLWTYRLELNVND